MSQLGQLKSQIESIAQDAKSTGAQLSAFSSRFSQSCSQVQATIGGSAQGKDREVVAAVQDAQRKVKDAVEALGQAARVATAYGRSL
jgi:gas vesicle protein